MGQESLSLFPSETDRDINRTTVAVFARPPLQEDDDQLAMFGTIEAPALPPALPPVLPPPLPSLSPRLVGTSARTPVALVAAIAILGLTGLVLLRPANSAPPSKPNPVAVLSPPLVPVVEAAAVPSMPTESAPSMKAPVAVATPAAPRAREVTPRVAVAKVEPRQESRAKSSAKAPAFTGTLIVDSVPQGAAVTMNQKALGITPLRLPAHPAGSYAIWVEHEGFERWTSGVRVTAETTTRVRPILKSRSVAP